MAVQKPYNINLFGQTIDGNLDKTITWSVSGDIQVAYQVSIINATSLVEVYNSTKVVSYINSHLLPSSSLVNGIEYKIVITIWNVSDDSISSDSIVFNTSSTPLVVFDAIGTVGGVNNTFTATYTQAESVVMKNWQMFLYDNNENLLNSSELSTESTISYLFDGFETGTYYKIECIVTSSSDLIGTTDKVQFYVDYSQPETTFIPQIQADSKTASVELSWYVIKILGTNVGGTFIDSSELDVTGTDEYFYFDTNFSIDSNFTMKVWLSDVALKKNLITVSNGSQYFYIQYFYGMFHLFKIDGTGVVYHIMSQEVSGSDYFLWIQQENGDFNLKAEVI